MTGVVGLGQGLRRPDLGLELLDWVGGVRSSGVLLPDLVSKFQGFRLEKGNRLLSQRVPRYCYAANHNSLF